MYIAARTLNNENNDDDDNDDDSSALTRDRADGRTDGQTDAKERKLWREKKLKPFLHARVTHLGFLRFSGKTVYILACVSEY